MAKKSWNDPLHPAEHLTQDWLEHLGMDAQAVADALQLPIGTVQAFLGEEAAVSADLALRLEKAFGSSAKYWLGLQNRYDLDVARARGVPDLLRVPGLLAAE